MSRRVTLSLLLIGSLAVSACGKKDETAPQQGGGAAQVLPQSGADRLTSAALLKHVPSEAQAFVVWDLSGPKYQALRQTPWASEVSLTSTVRKAVDQMKASGKEQEGVAAQAILGVLEQLGIIPVAGQPLPAQPEIAQAVAYVLAKDSDSAPEVALFVTGSGRSKLTDKLPVFEELLKSNGVTPTAETFEGGYKGFSVAMPGLPGADGAAAAAPKALYVAASDSALAIGLSKEIVLSAFKPAATDRSEALRNSAEFKRAVESVNSADEGVGLAYVSFSKLLPIIDQAAKKSGKTEVSDVDVAQLPFEALVWRQSVGDGLTNRWAISVNPKTESQTKIFDALKGSSVPAVAAKLPGDVALMFSLDARPLKKLEFLMNEVSDPQSKMFFEQASQLQGATVAIRNNDSGSPFPDLFLFVDSENSAQFVDMVKMGFGAAMGGMGGGAMPWKDMDIEGTKVSFMSTPLGVGLYMGQPSSAKTLVVASSQRSMKDALKSLAGTGESITSRLQGSVKDQVATSQGFVASYINFNEFANVVESVKNSLAMFAGENTQELDTFLNPAEIRKYGVSAGAISFANGIFSITSRTAPPSVLQIGKAAQ
jgi:hypothetical protein